MRPAAPPPTRGSTQRIGATGATAPGPPAHAGIDPDRRRRRRRLLGLPRPRGDRPPAAGAVTGAVPAPPPTRGSTLDGGDEAVAIAGSPAHAGIDPTRQSFGRCR